jgi:cytochrome P450
MKHAILPPGPKESPIFGSAKRFLKDLPKFLAKMGRDYGDLATFHVGRRPVILVNKPEYIETILVREGGHFIKGLGFQRLKGLLLGEGLLTSDGEFHLRQRRLAQQGFVKARLEGYAQSMTELACQAREGWSDGETRRMLDDMMALTLKVVARTLFSEDLGDRLGRISDALTEFLDAFPIHMLPGSELLDFLPVPTTRHTQHARQELDKVIFGILADRRANPGDRGDLLSMLMMAEDGEGGARMSDQQLRDEAMTMILAGHETTANALCWSHYLLSQNPLEYERMLKEVDEVLEGRPPTLADLPRLSHTHNVFMEALRLYPPVWVMGRESTDTCTFGDYTFPAGTMFFVCPYVTHRDHRFFDAPMAFQPDRFNSPEAKARFHYAYVPFSGGQRLCMGERFAIMEGTIVLAALAQKWRFIYQEHWPARESIQLTLRPGGGLPMQLRARA